MIISRWNGFEIDSSEGYYVFEKNLKSAEKGWDFLIKLLNSPLLWHKIAFYFYPKETHKKRVKNHLSKLLKKGLIEEGNKYEYCGLPYVSSISSLLDILKSLKNSLSEISLNFCIAPLKSLPKDEYEKLRVWFLSQFEDKKKGKSRWRDYCKIEEKDFSLGEIETFTDSWVDYYAFETNFTLNLEEPVSFTFNLCAGDPSLILYLISTLVKRFKLKFIGDHGISVDRRPEKIIELLAEY